MAEQETTITFQHIIGEQQIEVYMLKRELTIAQQTIKEQQDLINELRGNISEDEENKPTPIETKRSS